MIRFHRAALAATLTLALAPLHAQTQANRVPVTAHITVRDLDLGNAAGRKAFELRVRRAAATHCGAATGLHMRFDILRCRAEMRENAKVRLAALTHRRAVELAAITRR